MNQRLTRRRFAQMAIASTTVAGLGYFANKTFAQNQLTLYGARPDSKAGAVFLQALNLVTNTVEDLTTTPLDIGEKLIGLTSLADGIVLAIGAARTGKKENAPTRLVFLAKSPRNVTLSGLKKQEGLESLQGANDGSLIGLVNRKNNQSAVKLVNINTSNGEITLNNKIKLTATKRFSELAQVSNSTIYTIDVGQEGEVTLVSLDLGQDRVIQRAQLKFNNEVWNSGLSDLVGYSANQIFALGAPRYESPNNLYTVDASTGNMTLLREFDVTKITLLRA